MSDGAADITLHSTLYLASGDVTISSPTQDGSLVVFRTHKAILSQFSPIFADMFSLPDGDVPREQFDGVDIVHLPDNAEDIEVLFRTIHNPGFPLFKRRDPGFYSAARGLIEMASKYEVASLRQSILYHLEQDWPTDLAEYWRFEGEWEAATHETSFWELNLKARNKARQVPAYCSFPEPATAIRLAIDYNLPSILPAAFYWLSMTDPKASWPQGEEMWYWEYPATRVARWDLLHPQERQRALQGRERLAKRVKAVRTVFDINHSECGARWSTRSYNGELWTPCQASVTRLRRMVFDQFSRRWPEQEQCAASDPIHALAAIYKTQAAWGLCNNCTRMVKQRISRMLNDIWKSLPEIFELPKVATN